MSRETWRKYPPLRDPLSGPASKPKPGAKAMSVDEPARDARNCVQCGAMGTKQGGKCECPSCGSEWRIE